jgi:hypothetical protein
MQAQMAEAQAEMDRLDAELPTLSKNFEITENKNAKRQAESAYKYAQKRSEDLLVMYEDLLEQKRIRDEEWAFQERIDAQWDAYDEVYEVYQNFESNMSKLYDQMYRLLDNNGYDWYDPEVVQFESKMGYL